MKPTSFTNSAIADKKIKAFDFFCSVGGLTSGLQKAGINVSAGLDIDPSCKYAYEKNCKAEFLPADIRDVKYSDISHYLEGADYRVLVGCAPCQPFSKHTLKVKNVHEDERWNLINEFLRIAIEGKPEIIFMENVPQIQKKEIYIKFKKSLKKSGYHITEKVVLCSDFGVPQSRRRLVFFASMLGELPPPTRTVKKMMTVRDAIGNLGNLCHGEQDITDPLHKCASLYPINIKRIQASKPGGTWRDWPRELLPECYKKPSGHSYSVVYGRMRWDNVAPTLTTKFFIYGTGRYGHPEQDRGLSLREGAILQTFPRNYKFCPPDTGISMAKIGQYIGNAVPPALAKVIGKSILTHIGDYS